jgi:uncharacterized Zn finger protein
LPRESYRTKGARYLAEGRLTITEVSAHAVRAHCKGTGEQHVLTGTRQGWSCSCPAHGPCAHLWALQAVTVRPQTRKAQP